MTWLDLADTTIKIGLGAIIAGGFGYLTMRNNHKNEATKEIVKARRELLLKTVSILNDFNRSFAKLKAVCQDRLDAITEGSSSTPEEEKALEQLYEEYTAQFATLIDAEANLLLIGEVLIRDTLISYIDLLDNVGDLYYDGDRDVDGAAIATFNEKLRQIRKDILLQMSAAYSRPH